MPAGLCRDCGAALPAPAPARCRGCGSPRVVAHPEIETLAIAHIDCDAFFAAIEKRDDPSLHDKAVIVGGSRRGVVLTACYNAPHPRRALGHADVQGAKPLPARHDRAP